MLGLLLLPATALAQNSQANWGNFRNRIAHNQSNRNSRNGAWGTPTTARANHGGFGTLVTRTRVSGGRSGAVYRNNNGGYYGNPNSAQWGYGDGDYWRHRNHDWRRDRCVDPDHDGDCDFIVRRRPHRHDDWRRYRCVDPDHDGDCDFIVRHRNHRWHDDDDDRWGDRGWGHHDNGRHLGWYKHARHDDDEDDD
jgi:hypothetical protein